MRKTGRGRLLFLLGALLLAAALLAGCGGDRETVETPAPTPTPTPTETPPPVETPEPLPYANPLTG